MTAQGQLAVHEVVHVVPVVATPLGCIQLAPIPVNDDTAPHWEGKAWHQASLWAYIDVKAAEAKLYTGWLTGQTLPA